MCVRGVECYKNIMQGNFEDEKSKEEIIFAYPTLPEFWSIHEDLQSSQYP